MPRKNRTPTNASDGHRGVPCSFCAKAIPLSGIDLRFQRNARGFPIHTYRYESHSHSDRLGGSLSSFPRSRRPCPGPRMLRSGNRFDRFQDSVVAWTHRSRSRSGVIYLIKLKERLIYVLYSLCLMLFAALLALGRVLHSFSGAISEG
jgi:hypothetical protein